MTIHHGVGMFGGRAKPMTHHTLRVIALIIFTLALSIMTIVTAHAKPCGHGHIAANKECHK
jgi:hypothetical protein